VFNTLCILPRHVYSMQISLIVGYFQHKPRRMVALHSRTILTFLRRFFSDESKKWKAHFVLASESDLAHRTLTPTNATLIEN